jgi:hypothetical protein
MSMLKITTAAALIVAATISTAHAAQNWYLAANDGTCASTQMVSVASGGFGWASPYILADALRALNVQVTVETGGPVSSQWSA